MNELAYDLLRRIFTYCDVREIIDQFRFVSKSFHSALEYPLFWKQIYFQYFGTHSHCYDHIHDSINCDTTTTSWFSVVCRHNDANERLTIGIPRRMNVLQVPQQKHPMSCIRLVNSFVELNSNKLSMDQSYKYLITGTSDHKVCVWKRKLFDRHSEWKCAHTLKAHYDAVNNIEVSKTSWNSDKLYFYTSSDDRTINSWCLSPLGQEEETLTMQHTLMGHNDRIKCLHASRSDTTKLFSSSRDKKTKIWDLNTGQCIQDIDNDPAMIWCMEEGGVDNHYAYVYTGDTAGRIGICSSSSKTSPVYFQAHDDVISSIAHIPDQHTLISASYDKGIKIWDTRKLGSDTFLHHIQNAHSHYIVSLSLSNSHSPQFATCSADGWTRVWDYKTGTDVQTLFTPRTLTAFGEERFANEQQFADQLFRTTASPLSTKYEVRMHHGGVLSNTNANDNLTFWSQPLQATQRNQMRAMPVANLKMNVSTGNESTRYSMLIHDFLLSSTSIIASAEYVPATPDFFNVAKSYLYIWEFDK
jgi:WD40 repeat protein